MARDIQIVNKKKLDKKQDCKKYNKKSGKESDSDSSNEDYDEEYENEEEDALDFHEYRKLLNDLFPSKHIKEKVKSGEKVKETLNKVIKKEGGKAKEVSKGKKDTKEKEKKSSSKKSNKKTKYSVESETESDYDEDSENSEEDDKAYNIKPYIPSSRRRLVHSYSDSDESDYGFDEEDEDEEEDSEEEDSKLLKKKSKNGRKEAKEGKEKEKKQKKGKEKISIIFAIDRKGSKKKGKEQYDEDDEEDEDSDYEYDSEYEDDSEYMLQYDSESTEDEDASVSSVMTDDLDTDFSEEEDNINTTNTSKTKSSSKIMKKTFSKKGESKKENNEEDKKEVNDKKVETDEKEATTDEKEATTDKPLQVKDTKEKSLFSRLSEIYNEYKSDPRIKQCMNVFKKENKKEQKKREKKLEKQKDKNSRIFRKIMYDKNTQNDYDVFEKMEYENQIKMIKEVKEINKVSRIVKPYRIKILETDIPIDFKGKALKKANTLRQMEPGSNEYYKMKNWIDTLMRVPFGKYETLPVTLTDGVDKCHEFMENAQKTLDNAVYGLNDAKMQIMQLLGQFITNPQATGTAIAIHGAMGTGKTSLVKEGISKILNRPFAFIALGGATDSCFLEGHSYTYEGSTWGKIVQILVDSKCMNPVIYFDELDKISDTPKGEEIVGILTHLTDTTQNSLFHDKYFSDVDFDLSKCLFIFSYNDESKVNPILRDRMYRIKTAGYNKKEKTVISSNYLLPKIAEQVNMKTEDIIIPNETVEYIVDNYCSKEEGVRNLKRCLEIIYTKLNLYRLMKPGTNLFEKDMSIKVEFPFTVTKDILQKLIKKEDPMSSALYSLYV
jgi:ATP-dependent Lon protease